MKAEIIKKIIVSYEAATGMPCCYHEAFSDDGEASCDFCRMIQSTQTGQCACASQHMAACEKAKNGKGYIVTACHAGLVEWLVPVVENGAITGYFHSGFVINGEDGVKRIGMQEKEYLDRFGFSGQEFRRALKNTRVADGDSFEYYAVILHGLTRIYGGAISRQHGRTVPDVRDIIYFSQDAPAGEGTGRKSLSSYIYDRESDTEEMTAFWKTVEIRASAIFTEVMSGRVILAKGLFDEILSLAYEERDLVVAKISAEMLFHIIFLKYYGKGVYDTRFYRLAFETIRKLFAARTMDEIRTVMGNSFYEMYSFYNAGSTRRTNIRVVQEIMEYLEANYACDIRVADVAAAVYLSPEYASRLFKKETSSTIKGCLNQIRMHRAQEMLTGTRMPVGEIGRAVGYRDVRGFYKMFQKYFGMTCGEMRRRFSSAEGPEPKSREKDDV